ncbi:MAG: dTMP kinase [Alphaproteobacteria bacterium]|nr:dTMP kinase [Alphaproteobacteria bacterium]
MKNNHGLFISFEGGEGVGKSTQVALLAESLRQRGYTVITTREPGGSETAEQIRQIIRAKSEIEMDAITESLLIFAARRDHYVKLIKPQLQKGNIVICDRFFDSSLVYQGVLENVPITQLMFLKQMALEDFEPDITFVLDIPSDIARQRALGRQLSFDKYDKMPADNYEIIRNGFLKLAQVFDYRTVLINSIGNIHNIADKILNKYILPKLH